MCTDAYTDLTSRKRPETINPFRHLCLIQMVSMTKASSVLCCLLPPVCPAAIALLVSAQQDSLRVSTASKILLMQLCSAIGR